VELFRQRVSRVAVAVALAALCVPGLAAASHVGPDDGDARDWATGTGTVLVDLQYPDGAGNVVTFDATTIPGSGGALGKIEIAAPDGGVPWRGHVDCIVVHDTEATIGGSIDHGSSSGLSGRFALRTRDNPTQDEEQADLMLLRAGSATVGDCTDADFGDPSQLSIVRGDTTVHDHTV
jgi:hypothetical protein